MEPLLRFIKGISICIQRAKRQCDQVWVVVSGYEGDRGEQVGLTLQKRFRYIREAFGDDELTSVCKLDETNPSSLPYGLAGVVGPNVCRDFL